ncbi:TPA: YdaS family helix-turn-helix protein [Neisseria subflava]
MNHLDKAIKAAGGQAALAAKLGKKRSTVNSWVKGRNKIPAEIAVEIEKLGYGVRREDLRPDVFL